MELTWLVTTSLLLVGLGYVFVQNVPRPRFVCWGLLCASLFGLATRDLFRPHERGRPRPGSTDRGPERSANRPDDHESRRRPVFARVRRRVVRWLD